MNTAQIALTVDQDRALQALLEHRTMEDAAKAAGLHERTIRNYLRQQSFADAYRAARRELLQHTTARLQDSCALAVRTLEEVMNDKTAPAGAKVSAAKAIVEMAYRACEVEDDGSRMAKLEAQAAFLMERVMSGELDSEDFGGAEREAH